jgi:DNA polymerase elongation subunit (family B)
MKEAENGSQEEKKWDRKQASTKIIMNSIYGNLSSQYYRLSNEYLGDATTSTARYTLWKGEDSIEELDYEHIYSDTDSHFIQLTKDTVEERVAELIDIADKMDKDASEIAQDIGIEGEHPFLDGSLHGDKYTCMLWEPEKIWKKYMALGTKKRYAGLIEWEE